MVSHDTLIPVYDMDGKQLVRVPYTYLSRALDTGEVARDERGRYRLRKQGGFRTADEVAADKAAARWANRRTTPVPVDDGEAALIERRSASARKAHETRRRNAAARQEVSA